MYLNNNNTFSNLFKVRLQTTPHPSISKLRVICSITIVNTGLTVISTDNYLKNNIKREHITSNKQ